MKWILKICVSFAVKYIYFHLYYKHTQIIGVDEDSEQILDLAPLDISA